jgi:recombination protein RecA
MFPTTVIPTGSLRLDLALGTGGIPRGCFVEIAGPESAGKTCLCLSILAQAQQLGGECALIDADHSLDPSQAVQYGVDPQRLLVSEPAHAEQALETLERLAACGALAVIVLDSLSQLTPQAELHAALGTAGDEQKLRDHIAALLSLSLRRLAQTIQRTQTTLLFTRQTGTQQGPVYHRLAQNPARLALNLHAAVRLEMHPGNSIYQNQQLIGHKAQVRILRNRFSPCRQAIELDIMYKQSFRNTGAILELGSQLAIFDRQGTHYIYQGFDLGGSPPEVLVFLEKAPLVCAEIEQAIRQKSLGLSPAGSSSTIDPL